MKKIRKHITYLLFICIGLLIIFFQGEEVKAETYTDEAVFYLSDETRTTTYKYTISGFSGKENHNSLDASKILRAEELDWKVERVKGTASSASFSAPNIKSIKLYPSSIQAHLTKWYLPNSTKPYEEEHKEFVGDLDSGTMYYGISIEFGGFDLLKQGYEVKDSNIYAYQYGTNNKAYGYNHYYTYNNDYIYTESKDNCLHLEIGSGGVAGFKELYFPVSADAYYGNTVAHYDNLGFVSDISSFDAKNKTFTLNSPLMYFGGLKWRKVINATQTSDLIAIESDQPEFVFKQTPASYKVTFDANGGTLNDYINGGGNGRTSTFAYVEYHAGYYDDVERLNPQRDGYKFLGWYDSASNPLNGSMEVWDVDGKYYHRNMMYWTSDGKWKYTHDLTVYARWEPLYTIKYDGNGATSGSMNYADSMIQGSNYTIRVNEFQKTGFTPEGYYLTRQSDGKYFCNDNTWKSNPSDSQKKVFKSSGSEDVRKITLNSNYTGGSSNNYTFGGRTSGDTLIFKVVWGAGQCVVHYDGNGATSGTMGDSSMRYHESFAIKSNKDDSGNDIFKRPGYKFVGWNTDPNGNGFSYNVDQWVLPVRENTLYKTDGQPLENAHYEIMSKTGYFALDVADSSTDWGGNIQLWEPLHNNGQRFKLIYKGDGTYEMINVNSDLAVEVVGGTLDSGANIQQWERNGALCQRWRIKADGDGYYHIQNVETRKYMDVYGGVGSEGANVSQWEHNNNDSEKWEFKKVDNLINDGTTLYAQWEEIPEPEKVYYDMTVLHHKWVVDSSYDAGGYWQQFSKTGPEKKLEGSTYYPQFIQAPTGYYEAEIEWKDGWEVTGDKTFNAYYRPNSYTLTIDPNKGVWNGSKNIQTFNMKVGETKNIPNPTREGYSFEGWDRTGAGSSMSGTTFKMGYEDATLTADWKVNSYNVNVIAGYGIEEVYGGGTYKYGDTVTISAKVQKGFHWKSWTGTLGTFDAEAQITLTFVMPAKDVTMTANAEANQYTLKFHPNDGAVVTPIPDIEVKYDQKVTLPFGTPSFVKYTIDGVNVTNEVLSGNIQVTGEDGEEVEEINEEDLMLLQQMLDEKMLELDQLKESETTTVEELSRCEMEAVALIEQVNLYESQLEALAESVTENAYPSIFKGWSLEPERTLFVPTWVAEEEMLVKTIVDAAGLENEHEVEIILYAIWDDCPWIVAEDLYYTLKEAQEGFITHDELMSHASASDRENGNDIPPGEDAVLGTSFKVIDYLPEDFTSFTAEGSVTETYQVIDSAGNTYKKMITVYIVDSTPQEVKPIGTTRFINEKYYYESYENGGLEDNSVWKTDPEYVAVIKESFENSKNDTPIISFYFTHEMLDEMRESANGKSK